MVARILFRTATVVPRSANLLPTKTFVSSTQCQKTATETAKDAVKAVDRTVSQAAIKGLDGVEKANETFHATVEKMGMKMEQKPDPLEGLDVDNTPTGVRAKETGEKMKQGVKAGVRDAADNVKEATK